MHLTLGSYVFRNRGGDDDDSNVDFADQKRMFMDDPWSTLPRERVGVAALRERLQELLGQITDKAFSGLLSETKGLLKAAEKDLYALGPPRDTEREQQAHLVRIAGKFQEFVRDALATNYSHDDAFTNKDLRLITTILNLTADFNRDFHSMSHSHSLKTVDKDDFSFGDTTPVSCKFGGITCSVANDALMEYPELEEFIPTDLAIDEPAEDIMEWIGMVRLGSHGMELGTFGPTMLANAFHEQSQKWPAMTEQYIGKVILTVHRFFHKALELACPEPRIREKLKPIILDELLDRYSEGKKQAMTLVVIERERRPYTLSEVFSQNLQASRGRRIANALYSSTRVASGIRVVDHNKIETAITNRSNDIYEKEDIHDILESCYNVACKRFVDNVWHQVVDHVLMSGPTSPLRLFSEQWAFNLDIMKMELEAGESRGVSERREALRKRIRDLKEAMDVLR